VDSRARAAPGSGVTVAFRLNEMEFRLRVEGAPRRVGVLPGSYHPVTRAHLELAAAALAHVEHVLLVMPRELPHKRYDSVGLEQRLALLERAVAARYSIAISDGGLFIDIARECREAYGPSCETWFICGRDAAERTVNWDYGPGAGIADQLREYGLLVADRHGAYEPLPQFRHRVRRLDVPEEATRISATQVRERIADGAPWEHLVPENVVDEVRRLYGGRIQPKK